MNKIDNNLYHESICMMENYPKEILEFINRILLWSPEKRETWLIAYEIWKSPDENNDMI